MKAISKMTLPEIADEITGDAYICEYMGNGLNNDAIASRLRELHDLTRWIPVGERMPDDVFDYVHVYYDGMIATMCYSKQEGFHGATANRMEIFAREITHWRRIDKP